MKSGFQTTFWFRGADQFAIGFYGSECHRRGKAAEVDSVSLDEMVEVICVLRVGGMYGETSILLLYLKSRRVIFIMFESIKSMDLVLSVLSAVSLFCLDVN